jgi:hypothetical protein
MEEVTVDNIVVNDRNTFIEFLFLLRDEWNEGKIHWNNVIMEAFIDALPSSAAEILDTEKYNDGNENKNPSWKEIADIFKYARNFGEIDFDSYQQNYFKK